MTPLMISHLVLWALVIALSLVVFALVRQIGVLHDRIAPTGALMLAKGLSVGEAAPIVAVRDLDGQSRQVGVPREDGRNTLVMFVSPTCPVCKTLLQVLKSSSTERAGLARHPAGQRWRRGRTYRVPATARAGAARLCTLSAARDRLPDQSTALRGASGRPRHRRGARVDQFARASRESFRGEAAGRGLGAGISREARD